QNIDFAVFRASNIERSTSHVERTKKPRMQKPRMQKPSIRCSRFDVGWSMFGSPSSARIRRMRRGLSLLEVLFAIFVAAVGLLGLAALLTVGGVQTAQSEQADRSAAFARMTMRDVEARGYLRPFVGSFRSNDPSY